MISLQGKSPKILVIGDLMIDHYLWGASDRISPEAPVPIVRVDKESTLLGGAGNVINNLKALGAKIDVIIATAKTFLNRMRLYLHNNFAYCTDIN